MRLSRRAWFAAWMLTASVSCRSASFAMVLGTPARAATPPSQAATVGRKGASPTLRKWWRQGARPLHLMV